MKIWQLTLASLFVFGACSGGGGSDTQTTLPVTSTPNVAPTVARTNPSQTGQVGYDFSYDAAQGGTTFTDADGDTLTYSVTLNPAHGLSANGATITGIPDSAGDISVTITANDLNGGEATDTFPISISIDQSAISSVLGPAINLENLENYANQTVPGYITKLNDGDNPITDEVATLGRVLFYDTSLSTTGMISCATCHMQSLAFSDPGVVSIGVEGGRTGRHSMRLINTMFADEPQFFWDERAESHEAQESQPIQDHNEMGFSGENGRPDLNALITQMEATEYYEELFRFAFLDPEITEEKIQLALAQFTKSIHSFDSKYDEGRAQVNNNNANFPNFSTDENAGKSLFMTGPGNGGAGCNGCHRAPEFDIDPDSRQNGVIGVAETVGAFDLTNTRAPTLRDLMGPGGSSNGPFMHDGSLTTLRDVIDHYNSITEPATEPPLTEFRQTIDNRLNRNGNPQRLNLTEAEKQQLEAFLLTLTGSNVYTDAKWSDPF